VYVRIIQGDSVARGPKQIWEKYSRICRNAFKCAWMWKETSFNIDYEQVLFCIVFFIFIFNFQVIISITQSFIDNSLGPVATESSCTFMWLTSFRFYIHQARFSVLVTMLYDSFTLCLVSLAPRGTTRGVGYTCM